jgi:hypothetical protein
MTLSTLLTKIDVSSQDLSESYGYGGKESVPFQMITHLFSSPMEYNELKRLAYAGAKKGVRDPYSDDFAKQFDLYLKNLRTKVLPKIGFEIKEIETMSGAKFLYLREVPKL